LKSKRSWSWAIPATTSSFRAPERAILYQNGVRQGLNEDITSADNLVELLKVFFSYREPQHEEWEKAVEEFTPRIPDIASGVKEILDKERKKNREFIAAFDAFVLLCKQAINPNLSEDAVETMLIQHLLTERIFRKVFDNPEFTRRNIIAVEIEKVIKTITDKRFSRDEFLKDLDYFYRAIEDNARNATDYSEKQSFLNTVYERFFQGFSPKQADTHGIVYTPQPIVNFMVRSVEEILKKEFGKSLSDREVHILDPFVGTGNFIVRVMQEIRKTALPYKYANELHCNEVMLLPYYIASMNIEHAYLEATGEYKAFEGICLVDTFELAEASQASLFTAENTARVEKQKRTPIFVIVGNPPYNAWQESENDENRNRDYPSLDSRIAATYTRDSAAQNKNSLSDPYLRAFRWASDRIGKQGVVAFVSNNSFVEGLATDGVRKHLAKEFDSIFIFDLGGNVRRNPRLSGTTHNVFGIQVGVSINIFIRQESAERGIFYFAADANATRTAKEALLHRLQTLGNVPWRKLEVTERDWLSEGIHRDFESFPPLASKTTGTESIFASTSNGFKSNRDQLVVNFDLETLKGNIQKTVSLFNSEAIRYRGFKGSIDFNPLIKWSETLKRRFTAGQQLVLDISSFRECLYRPFVRSNVYFGGGLMDRPAHWKRISFPNENNLVIVLSDVAHRAPFSCLMVDKPAELHLCAPSDAFQCASMFLFKEDGSNRGENITDWALDQFRSHYNDKSITKWDILYYTYAVLHHPEYRTRYAANLKRELPRIPYAPDFSAFAKAGKRLSELHVDYEKQKPYKLEQKEKPGAKLDLRVEKMRLSKDKQTLVYNDFLTLTGIPKETYDYRLGNRSALEWVIDQYQVSTDKRSGITNDPNRSDDPEYILRLIGQVITVSLETVKIVNALPDLGLPKDQAQETQSQKAKGSSMVQ
jgi:predicted helicase